MNFVYSSSKFRYVYSFEKLFFAPKLYSVVWFGLSFEEVREEIHVARKFITMMSWLQSDELFVAKIRY